MIRVELELTPEQLLDVAQVLNGTHAPEIKHTVSEGTFDRSGLSDNEGDSSTASMFEGNEVPKPVEDAPASQQADGAPPIPADVETTASNVTPVELGKGLNGDMIPWDARIHGQAKKKNADGSWRLKQGLDRDVFVPQVEAELLAAMGGVPKPAEDVPAIPVATVSPLDFDDVPPPPPVNSKPTTFAELLPLVTAAKASGTLTDDKITHACQQLGLSQFGLIAARPDLIPQMAELLEV